MKRRTLLATSLAAPLAAPFVVRAQQWPSRNIRMIVPYAPGATGDIGGRLYGEELGKTLGQSVVIDNKTGAGGTIAMAELARATPDGYTLGVIAQGLLVYNLGLYKTPGYDPFKDLIVLSINFSVANVLVVHPSNPAKTVADVVEQARAKKGEYTFSSGGIGTSHHMSGVLLEMRSGVKMTHVPYRATPAGIQGVVNGGHVQHADGRGPHQIGQAESDRGDRREAVRSVPRAADHDRIRLQGLRGRHLAGLRRPGRAAAGAGHPAQR